MKKKIDLKEVLAIDGGLSYILFRYPQAEPAVHKKNHKFKIHDEKTASSSLKRMADGSYVVTDFGNDSKARNAVAIAQLEDNSDFITALKAVAAFYKYEGSDIPEAKPGFKSWPAKPDEAEGAYSFKFKEFEAFEIKTLFEKYAWAVLGSDDDSRTAEGARICTYYHFKCLESYTYTKEGTTRQFSSNELYPMFMIDEGEWKKLYKPKAEKKYRFQVVGTRPEVFIHGLAQAQKKKAQLVASDPENLESVSLDDGDEEAPKPKKKGKEKLEQLIKCSGGSDALNVAAMGYDVIWTNSETDNLLEVDYRTLCGLAYKIYNLPDIDITGRKSAHKLAMQYLEIRTIWLPINLNCLLDLNGNPRKDVRDYLHYYKRNDFKELVSVALPYQFWDQETALDRDGNEKMKFGKPLKQFVLNNVHTYNFLKMNGFGRFASQKEKDGFFFIREQNNIVKKIEASAVKDFIHGFLEERKYAVDLRNTIYNTSRLNDSSISNLAFFEGDFKTYGPEYQYLFFEEKTWKVTADSIQEEKPGSLDKHVWDHKVIKCKAKVLDDMFTITKTGPGSKDYDIEIPNPEAMAMFGKFMIQTSRVHWRKELEERLDLGLMTPKEQGDYCEANAFSQEDLNAMLYWSKANRQLEYKKKYQFAIDGELLTDEEKQEQKLHLVNKIFAIGYMLHRYKNPAKPWAGFVMDAKISEDSESHGGAGKGIMAKALYKILAKVALDGRNPTLLDNKHLLENVDADTDMIHVEDAHEHLPFNSFFASITSATSINPKQKRGFEIGYDESPKWWFDTNYGDRYTDPSSLRRKLYVAFGDYYHENNGDYRESRNPADDFGMNLFDDFSDEEWNRFYNFMAQCLKFYLGCTDKIGAPMESVAKRNLISEMGDHFRAWADVYFEPEGGRLNRMIMKEEALEEFIRYSKLKNYTAQRFKKALKAWSNFNTYGFNPKDLQNKQGLIVRKHEGVSKEFIYIQTPGEEINDIRPL